MHTPHPLHRRALAAGASLVVAVAVWLPSLHLFFDGRASPEGRARTADALLQRQLDFYEDPAHRAEQLARMRAANAEWDFMGRTFLVVALANRALDDRSSAPRMLAVIDDVLAETIALEAHHGQSHFLMPYWQRAPFEDPSARSVFVDGEIALMLAARQAVERDPRWDTELAERVETIVHQMERGPVMSAESYPDECWTFCNSVALAAVQTSDAVTGDDHSALMRGWLTMARERLVDPETGMLVSSYTHAGEHLDGPEGSSLFLAAHMLSVVDPVFARDQYRRARAQLGVSVAGFGYAREWPASWEGHSDVDSGPIVPVVNASAGASGMALLGAAAFGDEAWTRELHRSLAFAAFPTDDDAGFRYAASNQVGDAVLLYALSQGALFNTVRSRIGSRPLQASARRAG